MGAAGELFAVRKNLFQEVESDTVLDDFMISMRLIMDNYKIVYEPNARAYEKGSLNTKEELKRKIRIAAGGIQSIYRLGPLFNPFKYGIRTWQFISHRVLRWTITPFLLIIVFFLNLSLYKQGYIYQLLMIGQFIFYGAAIMGAILESKKIKLKVLYIPFYFCMMNYAVLAGIFRYYKGTQSVVWEKAARA